MTGNVEAEARELGWVPQEEFKGDAARWVPAEDFVERGKHVMPILRKNNEKLQGEISALRGELARRDSAIQAAQEAIEDLKEHQTIQTQKAVDDARKELKAQLVAASENGDHVGVVELTEQLSLMPKTVPVPEKKKEEVPQPAPLPPEFLAWQAENPWFGTDKRKTALATTIAQELRDGGTLLIGRAFFEAVKKEVDAVFAPKQEVDPDRPGDDKVSGSRNGSGSGGGRGDGKGYNDLPAEARQACDNDIKVRVGEGKRYKTAAEWRAKYAALYFQGQ